MEVKRATLFLKENCGRGVVPDSAVGEGGAVSRRGSARQVSGQVMVTALMSSLLF